MKDFTAVVLFSLFVATGASAGVDTLKDTSEIGDTRIYNWTYCITEIEDEDCLRYNAGLTTLLSVGHASVTRDMRSFILIPGWNGIIPDSSKLKIYCLFEQDAVDRNIIIYPVTKQIFEGSELDWNVGNYPDPDSGVTWNHAWLDDGDNDSLNWTTPGGDYVSTIADTILVTGTGQYFSFDNFNRILTYWDTVGNSYGCILINEDAFPLQTSLKTFRASEYDTTQIPLVILYYPDEDEFCPRRRKILIDQRND